MNCKKCGEVLPENALFCNKCGATMEFDKLQDQSNQGNTTTDSQPVQQAAQPSQQSAQNPTPLFEDFVHQSAAGEERKVPKGFSSKKNIIIIITAAIVLIVGSVTAVAIGTNGFDFSGVRTSLQLADRYLSEQNYEQAIIEFEKVLEIEPMNVDAYLGLAEAYMALGETDRAIKILEEGIEKTGSDKLRDKLEEIKEGLKPVTTAAEVTVTVTTPAPAEITAVTTVGANAAAVTTIAETTAETEPEPATVTNTTKTEPVVTTTAETKPTVTTTVKTEPAVTTTTKKEPIVTEPPLDGTVTILGEEYDIETTTSLDLYAYGITDEILRDIVPEIKRLTNLTQLWLRYNQITDITPLAQLTNLTDLNLLENQIADITSLANLTNLTCLYLGYNQITDITSLAKLTNLTELDLRENQITDITPLAKITNLRYLYLYGNPISEQDIKYLKSQLPNCYIVY